LIELIVVLAGIAVLASISSTILRNIFSDLENDKVQAHLNSLSADCLKIQASNTGSKSAIPSSAIVDTNLLEKNNYEENSKNSCKYFQINPRDKTSKTHFAMGFDIFIARS